ncbi:MAG: YbhB/YbcL family Raf kinase inhibitor-like protein [Elusimicrobiota bacterium]
MDKITKEMPMKRLMFLLFGVLMFAGCAGEKTIKDAEKQKTGGTMKFTSSAFKNSEKMPRKYTDDGQDVSPPLFISGVPPEAKTLVLIMDDPDAPGFTWDHWVVFNIPPDMREIKEGITPWGTAGVNSWGKTGYGGPAPPSGTHRYFFKLYAVDKVLELQEGASKTMIEMAMKGSIVAEAVLVVTYSR